MKQAKSTCSRSSSKWGSRITIIRDSSEGTLSFFYVTKCTPLETTLVKHFSDCCHMTWFLTSLVLISQGFHD